LRRKAGNAEKQRKLKFEKLVIRAWRVGLNGGRNRFSRAGISYVDAGSGRDRY
jgi:hypothetical protein